MSAPDAPASSGLSDERKRVADSITIFGPQQDLFRQALRILSLDNEGARLVSRMNAATHSIGIFMGAKAMDNAHGRAQHSTLETADGKELGKNFSIMMSGALSLSAAISVLAHELRHIDQIAQGIISPHQQGRILPPAQATMYNWFIEADAQATAVDIAWCLKQMGSPEAWDSIRNTGNAIEKITEAYHNVMIEGGNPADAKLAAFNKWFDDTFISLYTKQATNSMDSLERNESLLQRGGRISELVQDDLTKFGSYLAKALPVMQYSRHLGQLENEGFDKIKADMEVFLKLKGLAEVTAEAAKHVKPGAKVIAELGAKVKPLARLLGLAKNASVLASYGSKFMSTLTDKPQEPAAKAAPLKEKPKPVRNHSLKL